MSDIGGGTVRPGLRAITEGWTLIDDFHAISNMISAAADWTTANGGLEQLTPNELWLISTLIERQIALGPDLFSRPDEDFFVVKLDGGSMLRATEDPIVATPDIAGTHARAWRSDLPGARKLAGVPEGDNAALDVWLVEAPWAHPIWHSYLVTLVHLRPMEGMSEVKFYVPGATHEMWVEALDPSYPREPDLKTAKYHVLTPMNFAAQFVAEDDEMARKRIHRIVLSIVHGMLSPDTDHMRDWITLFGDSMVRKADGAPPQAPAP